jgi:hypothetical protein
MSEMSDRDAIRTALYNAIEWQRGLVDSYSHMPDDPERANALALIKKYKAVLRKRYGTDRHAGQDALDKMETIDLRELIKKYDL